MLLRLEPGQIDLRALSLLNLLFDRVCNRTIDPEQARDQLERIVLLVPSLTPFLTIAAYCALSVGASIILGGRNGENTAAALIGVVVGAIAWYRLRIPAVDRLFEVLAAFVATLIVSWYDRHIAPIAMYIPLVAGVVQVLPGLSLTESLHELASRHLVAGTARLGSVLMTLLSLACGFALALAVVGADALHFTMVHQPITPWWLLGIAVIAVATAVSILEHARARDYPWVLGSCAVAEVVYRLFNALPGYQVATFGAALVVGLLTNAGARYARIPQGVLLIPGLLILVPGSLSYESILFVLQRDSGDAAGISINSVIAAVEIVAGLLLAQLLVAPDRVRRRPL